MKERNQSGLRVKDKIIGIKAILLNDERIKILKEEENLSEKGQETLKKLENFTASSNWIQRFKDLFPLTSCRHTTTRSLPENCINSKKFHHGSAGLD